MSLRFMALVVASAGLLAVAGCNDDGTSPVNDFKVTVQVSDGDGRPVPDLDLYLLNDNDYMQDATVKAAVGIEFAMPAEGTASLVILDVEGAHVRTLLAGDTLVAGYFRVRWNGTDDEGVHMLSGRYTAHILEYDRAGTLMGEDSIDMLMSLLDGHPVGTTDEDGRLVITDRRLFPHLYDRPDMEAVNENGEVMGPLELDATMIFRFFSAAESRSMAWLRDVPGSGRQDFTWAPSPVTRVKADATVHPILEKVSDIPPPTGPNLRVSPNPFN